MFTRLDAEDRENDELSVESARAAGLFDIIGSDVLQTAVSELSVALESPDPTEIARARLEFVRETQVALKITSF